MQLDSVTQQWIITEWLYHYDYYCTVSYFIAIKNEFTRSFAFNRLFPHRLHSFSVIFASLIFCDFSCSLLQFHLFVLMKKKETISVVALKLVGIFGKNKRKTMNHVVCQVSGNLHMRTRTISVLRLWEFRIWAYGICCFLPLSILQYFCVDCLIRDSRFIVVLHGQYSPIAAVKKAANWVQFGFSRLNEIQITF